MRHRYGRISLQVGKSLNLKAVADELRIPLDGTELTPKQSRMLVTHLGNAAIDEIGRSMAVSPGALTALALLSHHRRGIEHPKLLDLCERLHETLCTRIGARPTPALATPDGVLRRESIREAVQMFADAELVAVHSSTSRPGDKLKARAGHDAIYSVVSERRIELDTSKNIIIHFFIERALLATALQRYHESVTLSELSAHCLFLSRLFKYEFRFRANKPFEDIFQEVLADMVAANELTREGDEIGYGTGRNGWHGRKWIVMYGAMLRNFVEGYRLVVRSLTSLLDQPLAEKDLIKNTLDLGQRMYHAGQIERLESISKPMSENALLALQDQACIRSTQGKLTLTPQYSTESALMELETKVGEFLDQELES